MEATPVIKYLWELLDLNWCNKLEFSNVGRETSFQCILSSDDVDV